MRSLIILFIGISIFSCKKSEQDVIDTSPAGLLMSNSWYLSKTHVYEYDHYFNQVEKDIVMISDNCEYNSPIRFLKDSVCYKKLSCLSTDPPESQGKWYLKSDSLFEANIPFRVSNGTGFIDINKGIKLSKLLEINSEHFIVKETEEWYVGSALSYSAIKTSTYNRK